MGTRVEVVSTGQTFEPTEVQVIEDVVSSNITESSGGLPIIELELPQNVHWIDVMNQPVFVESNTLGQTSGVITEMNIDDMGKARVTLNTKLNPMVRLTRAKPFVGTLTDLIKYYFRLGGVTTDLRVDAKFDRIKVTAQGWEGDLWTRVTKLMAVHKFEVALVSDYLVVRPWLTRTAEVGHIQKSEYAYSGTAIAKTIEIDYFQNRKITNQLVYPISGTRADAQTISAEARETTEVELEISASLSSIKKPKHVTSVSQNYRGPDSVYTVMDKDGVAVTPSEWSSLGGRVTVKIGPDSKSIMLTMVGMNNTQRSPYKLQFAPVQSLVESNGSTKRKPNMDLAFSSLFIVGTGVAFDKRTVSFPTGAIPSEIQEEVGATASEQEVSTVQDLWNVALPLLQDASGGRITMTGTIARVNQRGDSGAVKVITYGQAEELREGTTYGRLEDDIHAGMTYGQIEDFYNIHLLYDFDNQAFGNAAGARIFDPGMNRYFRITSATITMGGISFTAEDNLLYSDVEEWLAGQTYGYVEDTLWKGLNYKQVELRGMR